MADEPNFPIADAEAIDIARGELSPLSSLWRSCGPVLDLGLGAAQVVCDALQQCVQTLSLLIFSVISLMKGAIAPLGSTMTRSGRSRMDDSGRASSRDARR